MITSWGALVTGWHVRVEFLRRWGHVAAFDGLPASVGALERALANADRTRIAEYRSEERGPDQEGLRRA